MELKDFLKAIKLNEGTISMILGVLVIATVGILIVNYIRDMRQSTTAPRISQDAAQTETAQIPSEHTVIQGENLWQIAEKYYGSGYNWVDVAKANNLANANHLLVGQVLQIPQAEKREVKTAVAFSTAATANLISGDSYTVVKGDHLWSIAVRAYGDGYQWTKIAEANNLSNPDIIYAGTVLKLPR